MSPIKENLKVMLYWGWSLEQDQARLQANRESMRRRMSKDGVSIVECKATKQLFHQKMDEC